MQTDYGWQAQIPEHGDVPDEARRIVLQQQLATAQRRLKRSGTDAAKAQRLAEQYRARLRSSLGQTRYERLRTYVEEQKQKQREQLEPPAGPDLPLEEVAELRTRRREESVSALKKLGIDL